MCYNKTSRGGSAVGRNVKLTWIILLAVLFLYGCTTATVEQMYTPPKRSAAFEKLQQAIDSAMVGMEYASPLSGENRQTVQMEDLDGDGIEEYLLFARNTSENPLKVLIFRQIQGEFLLSDTIESPGAAFDLIEYVDLDGTNGKELVVGRQLSDVVQRSLSVYSFSDGKARQLMAVPYTKFVPVDLDQNHISELMVISRGESDEDHGVAVLYRCENGTVSRSVEASLSGTTDHIKRIMVSRLHGDVPAVFVASSVADSAIITDVFTLKNERFTNVSFSNESGTSVQTLRNYYVYADDIDDDGILELPDLIDMCPVENAWMASNQKLIRWYAMDQNGREVDKMFTFHNFNGGWYLQLDPFLTPRISVIQRDSNYVFYLWDEEFTTTRELMTIFTYSGADREIAAAEQGAYILHKTEGVVYAVQTEETAIHLGLLPENLAAGFHLIQKDWKNGET